MANNLSARGSADLSNYGGLALYCNPRDLPEGASPRCQDVDFIVGSVMTRPGLSSVYTYANELSISKVVVYGGVATFTYAGSKAPTVNEEFLLEDFTGSAQFLNEQTIFVSSVGVGTFTAIILNAPTGTYANQSGFAVSLVGLFLGPNVPADAEDIPSEGFPWTNPAGILGNTSYASASTNSFATQVETPASAANASSGSGSNPAWTFPANILSTSDLASVVLSNTGTLQPNSVNILANAVPFSLPSDAIISGIAATVQGSCTVSGSASGSQGPSACTSVVAGGWTNATFIEVDDGNFATYSVPASAEGEPGVSGMIKAEGFGFSIPSNAVITGVVVTAKRSGIVLDASVYLLKSGTPSGANKALGTSWSSQPTATYGSSSDLWSNTLTPADVNSSTFGVGIAAQNLLATAKTAALQFVSITVYYTIPGGLASGSLNVQLATSGAAVGTAVNIPLNAGLNQYTVGGSTYQWGTTITADMVGSANFGLLIDAAASFSAPSSCTFNANSLVVTVYYTTSTSDALQATNFTFVAPSTVGVTGIGVTFQAYTDVEAEVILQLVKNGVAVGTPKTQLLTTTPAIYSLGASDDPWDSTWLFSDLNSTQFGVQVVASGTGTAFINDLDMLVYITSGLENFNYLKSYIQNDNHIDTLALDASGTLWQEDVSDVPGVLSVALTGILPNTFAQSATADDNEYLMFSDLSIGTDRPRIYLQGTGFVPLSQVGPGAPPTITTSIASTSSPLAVTAYSVSAGVVTFTFTAQGTFVPVVGSLYKIAGTGNVNLDGFTFSVLGTPAPSTTQFSAATTTATGSGSVSATATPTNTYNITSLKQDSTIPNSESSGNTEKFNGQILLWSAGVGSTQPGYTITCYYGGLNQAENAGLLNSFAKGYPVYVYIVGAPLGNGTQLVTGHGIGIPPSETGKVPYFTFTTTSSAYQRHGGPSGTGPDGPGNTGTFQLSLATMVTATPITNLSSGASVQIVGASPSGWNNTFTILDSLLSGSYTINSSQMLAGGIAQFQYSNASATGAATVTNGQIIELQGLTNNILFNTTGVVQNATGSTFQISGFPGTIPAQANPIPESGQAVTFGTQFLFDPGATETVGTVTPSPIFGDTTTTPGTVSVIGGSLIPIGSGVRQGVCYFITESEYETAPSAPFTFTTTEDTSQIVISDLPIGPPNVIARALAFTEAGQNGVPGANFYVIEDPVTTTVNGVSITVPSTIINDNTTTQTSLSFTDAVLLNSREIDIQGDNLFNLIELGSAAWCVPYASRMFYGLQLNKVQNFTNLTFDGGYNPNPGGNITPLGWNMFQTANEIDLVASQVTGQSYYVMNTTGIAQPVMGRMTQSAYQDAYLVPIIKPNTTYSVRVAASAPSGNTNGTFVVDLVDYSSIGFGTVYGSFSIPFSSMTTNTAVFSGTLLTSIFSNSVSPLLQLRVSVLNMGAGADVAVDRLEVFPTNTPYLTAQVFGSYPNQPEAIDASSTGGIIDTTSENAQPVMGAFVMRDLLFLLKTNSMYSTQDNPNSEPGGWGIHEVSNRVGTCGINAYDYGEEWAVTACRAGVFGFNGGQPRRIMTEIAPAWEAINWKAGNTIIVRNDIINRRIYVAVPMPTGTSPAGVATASVQWLPNAPYNPAPTSPNVMLVCNYVGMDSFEELVSEPGIHATMFGTLADVDLRRKWSIWQVPTPAMNFITRQNGIDTPLFVGNGIASSKVYQFLDDQLSDDGVAINGLYTTYGFVNATKSATLPLFGMHTKRYDWIQFAAEGAGKLGVKLYPDTLQARYPYTIPGNITLSSPIQGDFGRPLNLKGQRVFVEFSTNAVGSWMDVSKMLLTGWQDPHSPINPTGGGNVGITSTQ